MPTLTFLFQVEEDNNNDNNAIMATRTSSSSSSPRRRSSRGSNITPNGGLSKDETAFSVLRQYVLEGGDFYPVNDPDNIMKKIWVREGKTKEGDDGDGKDWVKEDGFTVKKYKEMWTTEMADNDDIIVEWGHKLPAEAKDHLSKELREKVVADDDDADVVEVATAVTKAADKKKKANSKAPANDGGAGKKKKQKVKEAHDDDDDGLPDELLLRRKEWFAILEEGRPTIGAEQVTKTTVVKKKKARAIEMMNQFVHNVSKRSEAEEYKTQTLDPHAKRVIAQIDAYVTKQAAVLRNEFLKDMCLTNYRFGSVVVDDRNNNVTMEGDKDAAAEDDKAMDGGKDADDGGKDHTDDDKVTDEE